MYFTFAPLTEAGIYADMPLSILSFFALDMLRKADPPIPAEIWDSKTEEVLMI